MKAQRYLGSPYHYTLETHKKALAEFEKKYSSFLYGKKEAE